MNTAYKFTKCCGRLWGPQSYRYMLDSFNGFYLILFNTTNTMLEIFSLSIVSSHRRCYHFWEICQICYILGELHKSWHSHYSKDANTSFACFKKTSTSHCSKILMDSVMYSLACSVLPFALCRSPKSRWA